MKKYIISLFLAITTLAVNAQPAVKGYALGMQQEEPIIQKGSLTVAGYDGILLAQGDERLKTVAIMFVSSEDISKDDLPLFVNAVSARYGVEMKESDSGIWNYHGISEDEKYYFNVKIDHSDLADLKLVFTVADVSWLDKKSEEKARERAGDF